MRHLRIALISATFPPYWGGSGYVCFYNARELVKHGNEVHVYTPRIINNLNDGSIDGVSVHYIKAFIRYGNAYLLPDLLSLRDFDVVHLHFPFFGGETAAIAACMHHIPLVITYHQDVHLEGFLDVFELILRNTLSKWVLNRAETVLFTSMDYSQVSYTRAILRRREKHIGELPNGVDTNHFCPGDIDPAFIKKFKSSYDDTIALLVARLDRAHFFKGVHIFLKAISQLPQSVKAIIVGEGDLKDDYEAQAQKLGIKERVYFTGRVSMEELPDYYRLAAVTVLPSTTMGEAFGLVLVESLACETPVIATKLPGVRTVVSDGVDGYLVQPGDAVGLRDKLLQILSLPDQQRASMGIAGRRKVEQKYTWELAGKRLEQIYLDVIHQHGR
jgi:glycosyltransferase involved in cell wall biosynthesis